MAKIMVVEDDEMMCRFLTAALLKAGHDVTSCTSGEEAMEILRTENTYELLLADIAMSGIDGIALAKEAVNAAYGVQVMFIAGFAAMAMHVPNKPKEKYANVLSRPFHLNRIVENVDRLLAA